MSDPLNETLNSIMDAIESLDKRITELENGMEEL